VTAKMAGEGFQGPIISLIPYLRIFSPSQDISQSPRNFFRLRRYPCHHSQLSQLGLPAVRPRNRSPQAIDSCTLTLPFSTDEARVLDTNARTMCLSLCVFEPVNPLSWPLNSFSGGGKQSPCIVPRRPWCGDLSPLLPSISFFGGLAFPAPDLPESSRDSPFAERFNDAHGLVACYPLFAEAGTKWKSSKVFASHPTNFLCRSPPEAPQYRSHSTSAIPSEFVAKDHARDACLSSRPTPPPRDSGLLHFSQTSPSLRARRWLFYGLPVPFE